MVGVGLAAGAELRVFDTNRGAPRGDVGPKKDSALFGSAQVVMVHRPARMRASPDGSGGTAVSDPTRVLLAIFVLCVLLGSSCLFLVHCRCHRLARCGRWLFLAVLLGLNGAGVIAANHRTEAIPALG